MLKILENTYDFSLKFATSENRRNGVWKKRRKATNPLAGRAEDYARMYVGPKHTYGFPPGGMFKQCHLAVRVAHIGLAQEHLP